MVRAALALSCVALAAAAPAAAIGGGGGLAASLRAGAPVHAGNLAPAAETLVTASEKRSTHTCQATRPGQTVKRGKFIPVACEQPPKMNMLTGDTLVKAMAAQTVG